MQEHRFWAKTGRFARICCSVLTNWLLAALVANEGVMTIFEDLISIENNGGATHGALGKRLPGRCIVRPTLRRAAMVASK